METKGNERLAQASADSAASTAPPGAATCSAPTASARGTTPAAAAATGRPDPCDGARLALTAELAETGLKGKKLEQAAAYETRTCETCGATEAEAHEAELGFWVWAGGAACGACIGGDE